MTVDTDSTGLRSSSYTSPAQPSTFITKHFNLGLLISASDDYPRECRLQVMRSDHSAIIGRARRREISRLSLVPRCNHGSFPEVSDCKALLQVTHPFSVAYRPAYRLGGCSPLLSTKRHTELWWVWACASELAHPLACGSEHFNI